LTLLAPLTDVQIEGDHVIGEKIMIEDILARRNRINLSQFNISQRHQLHFDRDDGYKAIKKPFRGFRVSVLKPSKFRDLITSCTPLLCLIIMI
jgi:hypothetical protein